MDGSPRWDGRECGRNRGSPSLSTKGKRRRSEESGTEPDSDAELDGSDEGQALSSEESEMGVFDDFDPEA